MGGPGSSSTLIETASRAPSQGLLAAANSRNRPFQRDTSRLLPEGFNSFVRQAVQAREALRPVRARPAPQEVEMAKGFLEEVLLMDVGDPEGRQRRAGASGALPVPQGVQELPGKTDKRKLPLGSPHPPLPGILKELLLDGGRENIVSYWIVLSWTVDKTFHNESWHC
jgi:hypothetical protein